MVRVRVKGSVIHQSSKTWKYQGVCGCVCPYCADIIEGNKVFSRDTGGGIWRLLWVSRYSCV